MNRFVAFLLSLLLAIPSMAWPKKSPRYFDHQHSLWSEVLRDHVVERQARGLFNYGKLKKNPLLLEKYLANLSDVGRAKFSLMKKNEQLAFLINAYNAYLVKRILEHYPIGSVKELNGAFTNFEQQKFFRLLGEEMSLESLEKDWIMGRYRRAEVFFALARAGLGTPGLSKSAYTASKLKEQLAQAKRHFLQNRENNYFDVHTHTLWLAPVLSRYRLDLEKKGSTLKTVVAKDLADGPMEKRLILKKQSRLKFVEANWALNDEKGQL